MSLIKPFNGIRPKKNFAKQITSPNLSYINNYKPNKKLNFLNLLNASNINKSKKISENFSEEEYDVLLSSGEQVACSLIAGRLVHKGFKSRSWLSWQIPIFTNGIHKNSRINQIRKNKIFEYLKKGGIPIITGFQGINNKGRITTIGRGGSDASAIMIAKFFNAEKCIIYTDVEGVYTTDPNKLKEAKKIKVISFSIKNQKSNIKLINIKPFGKKFKINISLDNKNKFFLISENFQNNIY